MAIFDTATKVDGGIKFKGIVLKPIVEQCEGCAKAEAFEDVQYCTLYPAPDRKWSLGKCNSATHIKIVAEAQAKVNPLKASKRAAKGR